MFRIPLVSTLSLVASDGGARPRWRNPSRSRWRRCDVPTWWWCCAGHASAPGVGDPKGLRLGDCSTQRNLDERGRRQAAQGLAKAFRAAGVRPTHSSARCRCQDTARLMNRARSSAAAAQLVLRGRPRRTNRPDRALPPDRWSGPARRAYLMVHASGCDLGADRPWRRQRRRRGDRTAFGRQPAPDAHPARNGPGMMEDRHRAAFRHAGGHAGPRAASVRNARFP